MADEKAIECTAIVYGVRTTVDNSPRITIDLLETEIMQMALFAECQRMGVVLDIVATPRVANANEPDTADSKKSRHETKSLRGS